MKKEYRAKEKKRYCGRTPQVGRSAWTNEETKFLTEHNDLTAYALANRLGRTVKSIERKRARLRKSGDL